MLKLERLYKSETALEILQEAILSGDIESSTEITQTEAALSLGVSRMPVRLNIAACLSVFRDSMSELLILTTKA